jgi:heat shock protein HslJ
MMKTILLCVGLLAFSCSQKEIKEEPNLPAFVQQIMGSYVGSLRCVDCISVEYQIEINSDSSFVEHMTYLGKEDGIFEVHGNWSIGNDSILILNSARIGNKIKVLPDWTLLILNSNGKNEPLNRVGTISAQHVLLNDIWVLETLNKASVEFETERPRLEFHDADKKVFGFGGCNQVNGSYQIEGNQIFIGSLVAERKACRGVNEALFLKTIQQATSFKIINLKLYLFAGSAEKARFKKVD